jgi:hypothetical protein
MGDRPAAITVRMSWGLHDRLWRLAERQGRTVSELLRAGAVLLLDSSDEAPVERRTGERRREGGTH